ncbi:hypothetical protein [Humibacillus xanthopallidus]|uniref:hypothetical protein n=1 Tax=Humibacillus xanthopallidus TaxID=412689 RepID=UPI00384F5081
MPHPPEAGRGIPSRLVLWTLRRFWWAVLCAGIASGMLALLALSSINPGYESQARLLVGQLTGSTDSLRASASLGQTYADALGSEAVLQRAARSAGLPLNTDEKLLSAADVQFNEKSRILTIRTTWSDAATAQRLASLLVGEVDRLRDQGPTSPPVQNPTADVRAQENTRQASGALTLIQPATRADRETDTSEKAVAMLSAVAGSLLTFTSLCFLVARRHRRVLRVRGALANEDYLGSVTSSGRSRGRHDASGPVVVRGRRATEYAQIAARMDVRAATAPLSSISVVGTRAGPIAPEVALNLASAFAAPGRRVALVDPTDTIHSIRLTRPHLSVIQVDSPQEETELAERLLASARGRSDDLLVLTLPSLASALAGPWWLSSTDAVVLVGEYGDPSIEVNLLDCMDAIVRRGGRLLGVVLLRDGRPLHRLMTPPESVTAP